MYLKLIVFFFFKVKDRRQVDFVKNRLNFDKGLSVYSVFKDRLRFVYNVIRIRGFIHKPGLMRMTDACYICSVINDEVLDKIQYSSGTNDISALNITSFEFSRYTFSFFVVYISNVIFSLFSLFDLRKYELYPLYDYFHYRLAFQLETVRELHVVGVHTASIYCVINSKTNNIKNFVYFNGSTLNNPNKFGCYNDMNVRLRNSTQEEELKYLSEAGKIYVRNSSVEVVGNESQVYINGFSKKINFDIGFFSEGWWMRDDINNFSIENIDTLDTHLESEERIESKLEYQLFLETYHFAKKNNLKLGVYPHPCETRAVQRGFKLPYTEYLDNENCTLGANNQGVSNIYEAKVAVTLLPTSSIIADRADEFLHTIYVSEDFFLNSITDFNVVKKLNFKRIHKTPYDHSASNIIDCISVLDENLNSYEL